MRPIVRRAGLRSCLLISSLAVCATPASAQSVTITPVFAPDQPLYLEIRQDVLQSMTGGMFGDKGMETQFQSIQGVIEQAERLEDGILLTLTFDRVMQSFQSANQPAPMAFDSDKDNPNDKENPFALVLGPMLGGSLKVLVGGDGKVKSTSGMQAIKDRMAESAGADPIAQQLFQQIAADLGEESARATWGDTRFAMYAGREVKVGETWENTIRQALPALGDLSQVYRCTLKRLEKQDLRDIAVISYTVSLSQDPNVKPKAGPLGTLTRFESGEFSGIAVYDIALGLYTLQRGAGTLLVSVELPARNEEPVQTLKIAQKIESSTTLVPMPERERQRAANRKPASAPSTAPTSQPKH